jgi:poly(glycerol-phosphate) alpha-glucosyltransferase
MKQEAIGFEPAVSGAMPETPARRLRIAHVVGACAPETANGVDKAVYFLSRAQAGLGHDVRVVATAAVTEPAGAGRWRRRGAELLSLVGLRADTRLAPAGWAPDVVHLHSVHVPANIAIARALRKGGIPYCVSPHGGLTIQALERGRLKKAVFRRLWEDNYFSHAAFVHALTDEERATLREIGLQRPVVTVPNGVDLAAYGQMRPAASPTTRRAHPVFVFIGRLDTYHKGLDLLLRAFARSRATRWSLVLAGPDVQADAATLQRLAATLGVQGRVHFAGPVFGTEKAALLANADVFVHTSRWEGVSMSVLESAAAGKPCLLTVAADPGGVIAAHGGGLVVEPSVSAIASALDEFSAMDGPQLAVMGQRARAVVASRFTWPGAARAMIDAYLSLALARRSA